MATPKLTGGHNSSVLCVAVQPSTNQVVSGGEDGELCVWSPEGQLQTKITRPDADCTSVVFSNENPNLVYAAFGEKVLILDVNRVEDPIFVFQSNQDEVNQLALEGKEQFLAACDDSGETKVYGLQDRKVFKTLRYKHTNICSTVAFRPQRQWEIVTGGLDCRLVHWDFSRLKCLNQFNMQELHATPGDSPHMINPPFIHHLAWSPEGSSLAIALENGQIPVMDTTQKNLRPKHALFAHSQGVSQVSFVGEDTLISSGNDACIVQWDLSKAGLYEPHEVFMNGDSHVAACPEEEKALAITHLCRVRTIPHANKVNWMAVKVSAEGDKKVFIADQSSEISILNL